MKLTKVEETEEREILPDADEIERSPLPFLARITWFLLFLLFATGFAWVIFSSMDRIVVASGKLVNLSSNIIVQPLETSIIQSLNVRSGQVVQKGERLAILDSTFAQADKELVRTKLRSLNTQVKRLETELAGEKTFETETSSTDSLLQKQLFLERKANYTAQIAKLSARIERLKAGIETNRRDQQLMVPRVQVLHEMEAMKEELLAQQSVAKVSLLEAQERRLQVQREMQRAKSRELELRNELQGVFAEKDGFKKNWRQRTMEELLNASRERDSLSEQFQKADLRRSLVHLTSPSDAVVLKVAKLSQGSVVRAAETLFTLVPLGSELEAEVRINAADVGYVKVGSEVQLKFSAFPFQRFGGIEGTIRTISEDAFQTDATADEEAGSYYLSRITLKEARLEKMPEEARLLPGMTLTAEVVVEKRSMVSFILWPMFKTLDESIQEP